MFWVCGYFKYLELLVRINKLVVVIDELGSFNFKKMQERIRKVIKWIEKMVQGVNCLLLSWMQMLQGISIII